MTGLVRFPLLLATLLLTMNAGLACRSSDKTQSASSEAKEEDSAALQDPQDVQDSPEAKPVEAPAPAPVATPKASDPCATKPELAVCCEALIPSCNDCRDKNRKALEEWNAKCNKTAGHVSEKECAGSPPVVDCCSGNTEECRQCRSAAINKLMAWKAKCADAGSEVSCDKAPEATVCCQAMTPACDACRDRAKRVQQEWERRCR